MGQKAGIGMSGTLRAVKTTATGEKLDYGIVSGGGWRGALSRLKVRWLGPKKVRN